MNFRGNYDVVVWLMIDSLTKELRDILRNPHIARGRINARWVKRNKGRQQCAKKEFFTIEMHSVFSAAGMFLLLAHRQQPRQVLLRNLGVVALDIFFMSGPPRQSFFP